MRADDRAAGGSTFRPALLLMSGRTLGFAAAFLIPVVLVRIFDPAEFGTYKQFFLIAATLYGLGQLGMAESLFYFLPLDPRGGGRYVLNAVLALLAGGLGCVVLLGLAGPLVSRFLGNADLGGSANLLGLYLLFLLASAALEIVMTARKRYRLAAASYATLDVIRAAALVVPVLLVPRLESLFLGAVGFAALRCAATLGYLGWEYGGDLRPDAGLLGRQLAYAGPFQLSGIVEIAQANLHQYAVASRFDAATFAVYAVGCLQIPLVEFLAASACNVMMVRMAEERREGRAPVVLELWHDTTRKLALVFFPLTGVLLVSAHALIVWLFTDRYAASVPVFMVAATALLLSVVQVDGVLRVHAETRLLFGLNLVRLLVVAGLITWFLSAFQLVGAILVTVLAAALMRGLALARMRRLFGVSTARLLPWRSLAGTAAAAAVAAIVALLARAALGGAPLPSLLVTGTAYGLAYLAALHLFGVPTASERRHLLDLLERLRRPPRPVQREGGAGGGAAPAAATAAALRGES
jgi:O-antigen/teichoic acid export membrane protein